MGLYMILCPLWLSFSSLTVHEKMWVLQMAPLSVALLAKRVAFLDSPKKNRLKQSAPLRIFPWTLGNTFWNKTMEPASK